MSNVNGLTPTTNHRPREIVKIERPDRMPRKQCNLRLKSGAGN